MEVAARYKKLIDITEFETIREFIQEYIHLRRQRGKFTVSQMASELNLADPSSLNKVINRQRLPGPRMINQLCHYFDFSPIEEQYFRNLIQIEKSDSPVELIQLIDKKNKKLKPKRSVTVFNDREIRCVSNWYYIALLEMVKLKNFKNDISWIQKKLEYKISKKLLKKAIDDLIALKFIKLDRSQKLICQGAHFETSQNIINNSVKKLNDQYLNLAKISQVKHDVNDRHISGSTLAISQKNLKKAKKLIDKFQDQFANLMEETEQGDRVYHIAIQFFPISKQTNDLEEFK